MQLEKAILHSRLDKSALVPFPKDIVPVFRDDIRIKPVSHGLRNSNEREPCSGCECEQSRANFQHSVAPDERLLPFYVNHCRKIARSVVLQCKGLPGLALQCCILELLCCVPLQQEVDTAVTLKASGRRGCGGR